MSANIRAANVGMVPFRSLGAVHLAGMHAEVRLFTQMPSGRHVWTAPSNILTFRFAPRNTCWVRTTSEPEKFLPSGPLTFRPRLATWESKSDAAAPVLHVMACFDDLLSAAEHYTDGPCNIEDLSMIEMMGLLHDEIRTPGFASTAMVESISELLRIKLCRLTKTPGDSTSRLGKIDVALIHDYIEAQSGRSPSVTELAKLFDMSRRTLLRRFKNTTAMTVTNYITQVQVAKAKRLLSTSDTLIKQVAHETGFRSSSNFSLAFERNVGMTPTAFRNISRGTWRSQV